jgi:crotonobetainyl-CoA:carnitine CoA-transferase CaiB-like acyl-CoA transferase
VDTADVFIHSMRADAARRLGLDGASLRKSRPRLVYCAATGYGEDGPYAGSPAYDDIIQASSGIAWLQGTATNGGEPRYVATIIADKVTGLVSLYSILAALLERERTGTGLAVEVPMFETMVSFLMIEQLAGMSWEPPRGPPVYNRTVAATRRPYRTSDGYLSVMPYTDRHWHSLFDQLGHPELIDDPRLNSTAERSRNIDFAYSLLEEALPKRTTDEWLSLCRELDIPAARINSIEDLFHDPHLEAVKMFTFDEHVAAGRLRSVRSPVLFEGEPLPPAPGVPALGQHTVDLLREVGCSEESVADLLARSVAIDGC